MTRDRIVHAVTPDGGEIVRYDRAGKWYLEYPQPSSNPRKKLTLNEAVLAAASGTAHGGRYGGQAFDARLRRIRESRG